MDTAKKRVTMGELPRSWFEVTELTKFVIDGELIKNQLEAPPPEWLLKLVEEAFEETAHQNLMVMKGPPPEDFYQHLVTLENWQFVPAGMESPPMIIRQWSLTMMEEELLEGMWLSRVRPEEEEEADPDDEDDENYMELYIGPSDDDDSDPKAH